MDLSTIASTVRRKEIDSGFNLIFDTVKGQCYAMAHEGYFSLSTKQIVFPDEFPMRRSEDILNRIAKKLKIKYNQTNNTLEWDVIKIKNKKGK